MNREHEAKAFSHLDERGRARMVDVGGKDITRRRAQAEGFAVMERATFERLTTGAMPKGDVFATARIAGIQAAKRAAELIPLCHPLRLSRVQVDFEACAPDRVRVTALAEAEDRTGVEMEALTAVSVALLTLYDMCKAVDKGIRFEGVRLVAKSGGKSGDWRRGEP